MGEGGTSLSPIGKSKIPPDIQARLERVAFEAGRITITVDCILADEDCLATVNDFKDLLEERYEGSKILLRNLKKRDPDLNGRYFDWFLQDLLFFADTWYQFGNPENGAVYLAFAEKLIQLVKDYGTSYAVVASVVGLIPLLLIPSEDTGKGVIDEKKFHEFLKQTVSFWTLLANDYRDQLRKLQWTLVEEEDVEATDIPSLMDLGPLLRDPALMRDELYHLRFGSSWTGVDNGPNEAFVKKYKTTLPKGQVLILGGGGGFEALAVTRCPIKFPEVISLDHSLIATLKAKRLIKRMSELQQRSAFQAVRGSVLDFPYGQETNSLVMARNILHFLTADQRKVVALKIMQSLKRGGLAHVTVSLAEGEAYRDHQERIAKGGAARVGDTKHYYRRGELLEEWELYDFSHDAYDLRLNESPPNPAANHLTASLVIRKNMGA